MPKDNYLQILYSLVNRKVFLLLLMALIFSSCFNEKETTPVARQGIMDAMGFPYEETESIFLDGEWDFYANALLSPEEVKEIPPRSHMPSPGLWGKTQDGVKINYATYRLRVVNHPFPAVFSIRNHQVFSTFSLFLNGELIMSNGRVSNNSIYEIPSYHPRTISVHSEADTLDFVLQVSNHHYHRGGIAESFQVGKVESLLRNTLTGTGLDFFIVGSLLIMTFYYISLFFVWKKDLSSLYFSLLILVSILRITVTGQRILFFSFPNISWETMLRMEYGTFYIAPIFFILFFNAIYREEIKIFMVNIVLAVSGFFTLLVLVTPVSFFSHTLPVYQAYISMLSIGMIWWLIRAVINRKEGSLILLFGVTLLLAALLHDLTYEYSSLRGLALFPPGIFLFILCQSYALTLRFSMINRENQQLWEELDFKNQNLEQLVRERTLQLEKQKDLLEHTNMELEQKKVSIENQSLIMEEINESLEKEKEKSDQLLLNVLPKNIAHELKLYGKSLTHSYPRVSVLFVDFKGFSDLSDRLEPEELLELLHYYFAGFDDIARKYNLEKIKTIGDAYLCAGGLYDSAGDQNVRNTVMAAIEINMFVQAQKEENFSLGKPYFDSRIGIHTGPVVAGVVGKSKFAFDIWGATVNIAKSMEASCEPGRVNISECTYNYIKDEFICQSRGIITMKHKRNMQMYYVEKPRSFYMPR